MPPWPSTSPSPRLTTYTPADDVTRDRLDQLLALIQAERMEQVPVAV